NGGCPQRIRSGRAQSQVNWVAIGIRGAVVHFGRGDGGLAIGVRRLQHVVAEGGGRGVQEPEVEEDSGAGNAVDEYGGQRPAERQTVHGRGGERRGRPARGKQG